MSEINYPTHNISLVYRNINVITIKEISPPTPPLQRRIPQGIQLTQQLHRK